MIRESKSNVIIPTTTVTTSNVNGTAINLGNAFREGTGSAYIPESYHPFEDKPLRVQLYCDALTTASNITLTLKSKATGAENFTDLVVYTIPSAKVKVGKLLDEVLPNCIENNVNATVVMASGGSSKLRVELFANV